MLSRLSNECKNNVNQDLLVQQLKHIFPENPIINARRESGLKYSEHGIYPLELDVYYPKYNICFEFQDIYHYVTTWYFHEYPKKIQNRDSKKEYKVQSAKITLIVVPCWWDGSVESLTSTVSFRRPDLIHGNSPSYPIPLNPPEKFFKVNEIPDVGELMYAAFPIDTNIIFSHKWWLGEKYDGIRFCWNPKTRTAYSRNGSTFSLTASALRSMPSLFLDGEYWFGRSSFELSCTLVNDETASIEWCLLRMIAFDTPSLTTQDSPFELRYLQLLRGIQQVHPFIIVAPRFLVERRSPFRYFIQLITENGGEGIILRKQESVYEHGRSLSLLKLKNSQGDREGIVIGITRNSPQLLLPTGTTVTVPPEDVKVPELKIGDIVTFSYERVSRSEVPARPSIFRVRSDMVWEDLLFRTGFGGLERLSSDRLFLESFARKRNMDPLLPATWLKISRTDLSRLQRGKDILKKFGGSFSRTIRNLFPELHLSYTKLKPSWHDVKKRRAFFEKYAKDHGFDPLNAENWHKQPVKNLMLTKGIRGISKYHKSSPAQALLDLFPDIGLDEMKIKSSWTSKESRRRFFEHYAKLHKFDPLIASNWLSISVKQFKSHKRGGSILNQYGGSLARALLDLFPNIGLNVTLKGSWKESAKRRKFFEEYAIKNGFDALRPGDWYSQDLLQIKEAKGTRSVLFHHKHSVSQALLDLFPDIGLDRSKFTRNAKV